MFDHQEIFKWRKNWCRSVHFGDFWNWFRRYSKAGLFVLFMMKEWKASFLFLVSSSSIFFFFFFFLGGGGGGWRSVTCTNFKENNTM